MALWPVKAKYHLRLRELLCAGGVLVMVGPLGACSVPDWANPVEWYRDVSGTSKNDAAPDERNTQNLAKGGEQPYPNLASVPSPPTNALSAAERDRLRNSLSADQANAKYVENNDAYVAVPPQVSPSPAVAKPVGLPQTPAASPLAPAAPVAAAPSPAAPSQPLPQESPLTAPTVRSVPQGEQPRAAPPAPPGVPTGNRPAPQQSAALPLNRPTPTPSPPPDADTSFAAQPGIAVTVGTLEFSGNSTKLSADALQQVEEVAQLSRANGGTIRVTAYSDPAGGNANRELATFNLALDRARAVAVALTQAGIPARSVEIGASPPPPGQQGGFVELSLEY